MMNYAGLVILTVGFGFCFFGAVNRAPVSSTGSPLMGAMPLWQDPLPSNTSIVRIGSPLLPENTPFWQVRNCSAAGTPFATNWLSFAATGLSNSANLQRDYLFKPRPPCIYKTVPYSMLVIIPSTTLDDNIIKPTSWTERMLTIKPELKFIPWK